MAWKTISSKCPKCGLYKNFLIVFRLKTKGKTYFLVKCSNCNYLFEHQNHNLWRELKYKYSVPTEIIRKMKREVIEKLVKESSLPFLFKDDDMLILNGYLFIKNNKKT